MWKAAPTPPAATAKEVASYRTSAATGDGTIQRKNRPVCPMKFAGLRVQAPAGGHRIHHRGSGWKQPLLMVETPRTCDEQFHLGFGRSSRSGIEGENGIAVWCCIW